jgi:hypothetical protein
MDGGSADIAGANICPPIPGHKKTPTEVGVFELLAW